MKVIFAEDTPIVQRMYSRALEEAGIDIIALSDGTQVLDTALRERPDIIVLDLMMPNVNGLEALKALKDNPDSKPIPVIMLSAYQEDKPMLEAMNLGASRYLLKSNVEPAQIVEVLRETVNQASGATGTD